MAFIRLRSPAEKLRAAPATCLTDFLAKPFCRSSCATSITSSIASVSSIGMSWSTFVISSR